MTGTDATGPARLYERELLMQSMQAHAREKERAMNRGGR